MVYINFVFAFLLLAYVPGLSANSTFPDFQANANVITGYDGKKALIHIIDSYDHSTKTAAAVVDTKDPFGNTVRKRVNLKISPAKFKAWTLSCLRLTTVCGAAGALYTAYTIADWIWDFETGEFTSSVSGDSYNPNSDQCPGNLINIGGTWHRKTNCFNVSSSYTTFDTPYQTQQLAEWATPGIAVSQMGPSDLTIDGVTSLGRGYYYRYRRNGSLATIPSINTSSVTNPTPEQLVDTLAEDPRAWQISPGIFPDIFEMPEIGDSPTTDPETDPVTDWVGGRPTDNDIVDISTVPSITHDVSLGFSYESWLPADCPAPLQFEIMGSYFVLSYETVCSGAQMMRPFVVIAGMAMWLVIVFRGTQS